MYNGTMPKTVKKWIDKNKEIVEQFFTEDDEFEPEYGTWSIWLYLAYGKCNGEEGYHILHEATAGRFLEATKNIKPCACPECQQYLLSQTENTDTNTTDGSSNHA